MNPTSIRPASAEEEGELAALLELSELPVEGLEDTELFVLEEKGAPLGVVGLEVRGPYALLRSLAVKSEARSKGYGRTLLAFAEEEARCRGVQAVFGLTTTIPELLTRYGFMPVERTDLPAELSASAELRGACPASAQAFRKALL